MKPSGYVMHKAPRSLGSKQTPMLSGCYPNMLATLRAEREWVWRTLSENLSWIFDNSNVTIAPVSARASARPH